MQSIYILDINQNNNIQMILAKSFNHIVMNISKSILSLAHLVGKLMQATFEEISRIVFVIHKIRLFW